MAEGRYEGFPNVFIAGNREKALRHLGRAKGLLGEVQRLRELMGVGVVSRTIFVDGVEIRAKSFVGIEELYLYSADAEDVDIRGEAYRFPVVLSGYVRATLIHPERPDYEFVQAEQLRKERRVLDEAFAEGRTPEIEELRLTEEEEQAARFPMGYFMPTKECLRVYGALLEGESVAGFKSNALRADSSGPFASYNGLNPENNSKYRAYRFIRAGWQSGLGAKAMQLVLGLHRSSLDALTSIPEFLLSDNDRLMSLVGRGERVASAKYAERVAEAQGFVGDYSHTWGRTDNIVSAGGGMWLVRIETNRVLARRLPVFFGSGEEEYIQAYEEKGAFSVAEQMRYFKGLPTGESFGTAVEIREGLEQGWIIDITPPEMPFVGGYYAPYETCGWSFSGNGTVAHNTGIYYDAGEDIHYSRWASMTFSWEDGLVCSARVHRTDRVFVPVRRMNRMPYQSIPLKVPTGYMGAVESLSFDTEDPSIEKRRRIYDAVVWVGYVGGELRVVSYYYNALARAQTTLEGDPPPKECPQGGAWEWGEDYGVSDVPPCIYTNAWDDRTPLSMGGRRYRRVSTKTVEYMIGGHLIMDPEWAYFIPQARFRVSHEAWVRSGDSYGAFGVVYADRGMFARSAAHVVSEREDYSKNFSHENVGGNWTAWAFRCFVKISYAAPCLGEVKSVQEACNQKCRYMMGQQYAPEDTKERLICVGYGEATECTRLVDLEPPSRCTDMSGFFEGPPTPPLPSNETDKQQVYKTTTFGGVDTSCGEWVYKPQAYLLVHADGVITRPSFDPYTELPHTTGSSQNHLGYEYSCFSIDILETGAGNAAMGVLHSGDSAKRTDITFVGVAEHG